MIKTLGTYLRNMIGSLQKASLLYAVHFIPELFDIYLSDTEGIGNVS